MPWQFEDLLEIASTMLISGNLLSFPSMHSNMCSSSQKIAKDGWRKRPQHMLAALSCCGNSFLVDTHQHRT